MKTYLFLFIALLILVSSTFPQPNYTEQNSGVTTSLNSASTVGQYMTLQVWICGNNGVVLKSTNLGNNWLSVGSNGIPSGLDLFSISTKAFDTVLTAGDNSTSTFVYRTTNGGLNWILVFTQANGKINSVWMKNAAQGFMVGNPVGGRWSLWKTTNGGASWDSSGMYLPQAGSETGFNNSLAIIGNRIWFGTNNSRIYRSTNNGLIWTSLSTPEVNSTGVWSYWDTTNSLVYTLFGGNNVYNSTNGGNNWSMDPCPDTGTFKAFCPAYYGVDAYPTARYAVRQNSKIYFSNGGFGSFIAEHTAPAGLYNHMAYEGYLMYTWAVRSNGGITRFSLFRGGAVQRISSEIPKSFSLAQNYPNPFNPVTKIRFEIPSHIGFIMLTIYDVSGKLINIVFNENLSPGIYETDYDASLLSSGIYFYRLEAGDYVETKRMILVK